MQFYDFIYFVVVQLILYIRIDIYSINFILAIIINYIVLVFLTGHYFFFFQFCTIIIMEAIYTNSAHWSMVGIEKITEDAAISTVAIV